MNYNKFYKQLFQPVEERIGPVDEATIMAIIGFDCGGPLSLSTVGRGKEHFVTYITCELAVNELQKPAKLGRYEFMLTCDDEDWARNVLTRLGQMSLNAAFGHGHTIDISQIVEEQCAVRGLVVEEFSWTEIDGKSYGILRVHGVTQSELNFAMGSGSDALLAHLKSAQIYPNTSTTREKSAVFTS